MQFVAAHARRASDAIAFLAPGRPPLGYGALIREVDRIQHLLASKGLGGDSRIGVALPNGPEMAMLVLAVTDCATCAPINPSTDEGACQRLLEQMRIDALVVAEDPPLPVVRAAQALGLPLLRVSFAADDPAGLCTLTGDTVGAAVDVQSTSADKVMLLLHTSGTTGAPKIVPLRCRNIVTLIPGRIRTLQLTATDRCLWMTPMHTSAGIRRNLFPMLSVGASVVCLPGLVADQIMGWLRDYRPTCYFGTPAIHRAVLDALDRVGTVTHSLRFLTSGSAPIAEELQRRLEAKLGVPLLQGYGSTEASVITQELLPPATRRDGSVGAAIDCDVAILAEDGSALPPDSIGEIVVRGPAVFDGYEHDADSSRVAFRDGWFRTGDLGFVDRDGFLFLRGRISDVINRGGFKVPPSEVDAALAMHPDVVEAVTFPVPHATLGDDVAAAVVLRGGAGATELELRHAVMQRLSNFKVPTRIVSVPSIPKSALGKYNRRELARLFTPLLRIAYVAPREGYETLVANVVAQLLGIEHVGAHDNFFDLGGDSLRGAQVATRIGSLLGIDVSPILLFLHPSVAELTVELNRIRHDPQRQGPPPIVARRRASRTKE